MPFPFLPGGALVAAAVLLGALTVFGLALRALDRAASRAASELRVSILPGVVAGLRRWAPPTVADPGEPARSASTPKAQAADGIEIEELPASGRRDA